MVFRELFGNSNWDSIIGKNSIGTPTVVNIRATLHSVIFFFLLKDVIESLL